MQHQQNVPSARMTSLARLFRINTIKQLLLGQASVLSEMRYFLAPATRLFCGLLQQGTQTTISSMKVEMSFCGRSHSNTSWKGWPDSICLIFWMKWLDELQWFASSWSLYCSSSFFVDLMDSNNLHLHHHLVHISVTQIFFGLSWNQDSGGLLFQVLNFGNFLDIMAWETPKNNFNVAILC